MIFFFFSGKRNIVQLMEVEIQVELYGWVEVWKVKMIIIKQRRQRFVELVSGEYSLLRGFKRRRLKYYGHDLRNENTASCS